VLFIFGTFAAAIRNIMPMKASCRSVFLSHPRQR
jgi:hypothetical protein